MVFEKCTGWFVFDVAYCVDEATLANARVAQEHELGVDDIGRHAVVVGLKVAEQLADILALPHLLGRHGERIADEPQAGLLHLLVRVRHSERGELREQRRQALELVVAQVEIGDALQLTHALVQLDQLIAGQVQLAQQDQRAKTRVELYRIKTN